MNTTAVRPSILTDRKVIINPESATQTAELTAADRCDQCGAAALVRAVRAGSELIFCGSHGASAAAKLVSTGWAIDDQTYRAFDEKPRTMA